MTEKMAGGILKELLLEIQKEFIEEPVKKLL